MAGWLENKSSDQENILILRENEVGQAIIHNNMQTVAYAKINIYLTIQSF
jgi:hypothetical protein